MDKNTLWGLLLMGAVIFGFMYLSRPNEQQQRELAEQQAKAEAERTPASPDLKLDSLTPAEITGIAATIRELGVRDTADGTTTLAIGKVDLKLAADGTVGGTIFTDGNKAGVDAAAIVYNRAQDIPLQAAVTAMSNLRSSLADAARYKGFARYLQGDSTTTVLENDVLALEISNKGGIIARARLKDYDRYDSTKVEVLSPGESGYSFILSSDQQHFNTGDFYFVPVVENDSTVTMKLDLGNGAVWGLRYTLAEGQYTVRMDVVQQNMGQIIPANISEMEFTWSNRMHRNEAGRMFEERNSGLYYMLGEGDVDHLSENSSDDKEVNERLRWISFKNQFFSSVMIARDPFTSATLSSEVLENDPNYLKSMKAETTLEYSSSKANPASFTFYLGPNSYPLLKDIQDDIVADTDLHLTNLVPLGWWLFRYINTWIVIPVFDFLGQFNMNYGIIILLLTIFIKIILFPFTYKSYMSQAKMRVLAPEIKEINDKYPGNENAMKRQQETMALYSRAGANPMSGCLPLLLQMPILIAMFNFFPSAIELRGQSFLWVKDLSAPDAIVSWTTNIPLISSTFGNHISLFCLLMTVTNIIYTKINMQSQASTSMPGMKWMMYLMPLMFLVFFNNYAAGLSYYYFLSLLITIVQTWAFRRVVNEEKVRATMRENAKKPKKKSGFMARLEEAQRRQQQLLKEQERQRSGGKNRRR